MENKNQHSTKQTLKTAWSFISFILTVVVMVSVIMLFVMQSYDVDGTSMEPTLEPADRLIISKVGHSMALLKNEKFVPDRGDIIVFHNPQESPPRLIKRVVGLPGDRVVLRNGRFTVYPNNGKKSIQFEKKFDLNLAFAEGEIDEVIQDDFLFVSGDNRNPGGSLDSRNSLGQVPTTDVIGTLVFRLFPLNESRTF